MALRLAVLGTTAMVALAGFAALSVATPAQVAILIALSFLPYAGLAVLEVPSDTRKVLFWSVALALGAGIVLVVAPSLLSDDIYRYLWDGRVSGHGIDPYRYAPDDPALFALRDGFHSRVNNPEIPTIYPPLAQLFFWFADRIAHAPWTLKALALLAHLLTIPVVARLAPVAHAPRATLLYALNPLALTESALGGHVDIAAGLAIAAFALSLSRGRVGRAALLAAAATGLKLVGLIIAPLVALRSRRALPVALLLCLAIAAPIFFAGGGSGEASGIGHYARRWQGNAGLFTLLDAGARVIVDEVARDNWSANDQIRLPGLAPIVGLLEGTPLDPWSTQIAEKKQAPDRTVFQRAYGASMLARAVAFGLVLALALWLVRRGTPALAATRWVIFSVLLLAPQLHPWYLLWLLPLEAATGRVAGLIFSATILASYAPLGGWLATHRWLELPGTAALIHLPVLAVLAFEASPSLHRRALMRWPRLRLGKIQ